MLLKDYYTGLQNFRGLQVFRLRLHKSKAKTLNLIREDTIIRIYPLKTSNPTITQTRVIRIIGLSTKLFKTKETGLYIIYDLTL